MTITYRGISTAAASTSNPNSVAVISGIQDGDYMLLAIGYNVNNKTPSPPAGWTLIDSVASASQKIYLYGKVASGESGSYSVSWTATGGSQILGVVAFYSDTGKSIGVDVHASQANAGSTNHTCPGVTTTRDSDMLACFFTLLANSGSTADASMSERWDYDSNIRFYCMTGLAGTAGATGDKIATGASATSCAVTVALYELTPPTNAPTGLSATAASTSQINLSWSDNSSDETGFEIEQSDDGATGWSLIHTTAANATSYSVTGLGEHVTKYFRVRAVNADGATGYSNTAHTATKVAAPSSFSLNAVSDTQINLTWTDNSGVEDGFSIERSLDNSNWTTIHTNAANSVTYSDTGLTQLVHYYYRVAAYAGSDYSSYATANTTTKPAKPTGLTATTVDDAHVNLAWTDNASGETGYSVERSLDNSTWTEIATPAANSTSYADSGLTESTLYYYRVSATVGSNKSLTSDVASTTTYPTFRPPGSFTATKISEYRIRLTWTDPNDDPVNETAFLIERSLDGSTGWTQVATLASGVTTWDDTDVEPNTTFYYRSRSYKP